MPEIQYRIKRYYRVIGSIYGLRYCCFRVDTSEWKRCSCSRRPWGHHELEVIGNRTTDFATRVESSWGKFINIGFKVTLILWLVLLFANSKLASLVLLQKRPFSERLLFER